MIILNIKENVNEFMQIFGVKELWNIAILLDFRQN